MHKGNKTSREQRGALADQICGRPPHSGSSNWAIASSRESNAVLEHHSGVKSPLFQGACARVCTPARKLLCTRVLLWYPDSSPVCTATSRGTLLAPITHACSPTCLNFRASGTVGKTWGHPPPGIWGFVGKFFSYFTEAQRRAQYRGRFAFVRQVECAQKTKPRGELLGYKGRVRGRTWPSLA